jgi:DNA relaxase NicK
MDATTTLANAGTTNGIETPPAEDAGACPPCVTRGAKCAKGVYLGLDWLRFVGPESHLERVRAWLCQRFRCVPEAVKGRHCCEHGETYTNGVSLMWGHRSEIVIVEFNGAALAPLSAEDRHALVKHFVAWNFWATRIDIAADFVDQGLAIVDQALTSCRRDELCGARRFRPIEDRTATESHGKTVYLGLRGKEGSGRLGRVYDKGLESKTAPEGHWERYEVEYTKETAEKVAEAIAQAADWTHTARALLLGAFDFRRANGRKHLASRPRADWWAKLIGLLETIRISLPRPKSELYRFAAWSKRCVFPSLLAMAQELRGDLDALKTMLCGDDIEPKEPEYGSVIEQFRDWLAEENLGPPLAVPA